MSVEKAKAYHADKAGPKKMNCAQAVIAAFKEKYDLPADAVDMFASFGAGRAPEGQCGALYAAKYILEKSDKGKIALSEKIFIASAGSAKCKEIRKMNKLSCSGCVEKAAGFL